MQYPRLPRAGCTRTAAGTANVLFDIARLEFGARAAAMVQDLSDREARS
jgi:hypothetical protein